MTFKPARSTKEPTKVIPVIESLDHLALSINTWASATFPDRTDQGMYLKMYSEIAEMIEADDTHVGGELADVLIMLLDFGKRRGLDIEHEIRQKMAINRERTWTKNKLGAFSHVKR